MRIGQWTYPSNTSSNLKRQESLCSECKKCFRQRLFVYFFGPIRSRIGVHENMTRITAPPLYAPHEPELYPIGEPLRMLLSQNPDHLPTLLSTHIFVYIEHTLRKNIYIFTIHYCNISSFKRKVICSRSAMVSLWGQVSKQKSTSYKTRGSLLYLHKRLVILNFSLRNDIFLCIIESSILGLCLTGRMLEEFCKLDRDWDVNMSSV